MKNLSPRTAFPTGWQTRSPDRGIAQARAVLAIENLLPRLWPAFGFVGAYLTLALLGLFVFIPWPLQVLLLAATITATGLSLHEGLQDFVWPRSIDGARRLERDSALSHRPLSERGDVLAAGSDDFAQSLWTLHQARTLPNKFRLAAPRADWDARDPHHLRWYLAIAMLAALVLARGDTAKRLIAAFDSGAGTATLDAWIDPPPYTGLPLTSLHTGDGAITVPQGSVLNLRVHGAPRTPGLSAGSNITPRFTGEDGEYSANVILATNAQARIQVGGHAIGKWTIQAIPDAVPIVAFTAKPKATPQLATIFAFDSRDDYGVTSVHAVLTPRHGKKLVVDLPLPDAAKHLAQTSYVDLTSHPYAGLMVEARLEARDAIGQVGISKPVTFRLPARLFTDPLARALVEQRQLLATGDTAQRKTVLLTLDALTIAPERFYQNQNDIFLALRSAFNGVKNAKTDADISRVEDLLWQTALKLERGGLLSAAQELRKLQAMLTAALASGAPQEVIEELLKRYNEAMQRYMQAMAANPPAGQPPPAPDAKMLGMDDVQTLMQTIQKLSQAGEREKAAQLLAVLQAMLENMHMTQGGSGQSAQNKALNEAVQKFGGLMGKQRALLDKTFRQQQGQSDPKDGGAQGLSKQQGDLQKELGDAMKGMDPKSAGKLREAGKAMAEAQGALGHQDLSNAGSAQNQALESLRQGAEALSQQAQSQGQTGKQAGGQDPLGRGASALGSSGVKIPGPTDLARARAILEELRRRAGEMNRSQQERDYLDRLLKAF
jgi:uncharacterized protein (TIGR02302 family)